MSAQAVPAVRVYDSNQIDVISRTGRRVGPVISTAGIVVDKGGFRGATYDNFNIGAVTPEDGVIFIRYGDKHIYDGSDGGHFAAYGPPPGNLPGGDYYTGDGELIDLDYNMTSDANGKYFPISAMTSQILKPDGETLTFYYQTVNQHFAPTTKGNTIYYHEVVIYQVRAVVSSLGWMAKYEYDVGGTAQVPILQPKKTYLINTSVDYCDPTAASCSSSNSALWPTFQHSTCSDGLGNPYICGGTSGGYTTPSGAKKSVNMFTATSLSNPATVKMGDNTWKYIYSWGTETTPGSDFLNSFQATQYNPDGSQVKYVSDGAYVATTTYNNFFTIYNTVLYNGLPLHQISDMDIFDAFADGQPLSYTTKITLDMFARQPILYVDELGRKTQYTYYENNTAGKGDNRSVKRVITPEATYSGTTLTGGYTEYAYDARRNITNISVYPIGGGAPLVTAYEYEAACDNVNYRYCNKAKKITDPKGNITQFVYNTANGEVATKTEPADLNGVKPQTRYTYTQLYPKVLNSAGTLVNSTPVWRLTKISVCRSATAANPASCVGTDQESVTEYAYANNNLLLTKTTTRAGNANVLAAYSPTNLWQSSSQAYDYVGNVISIDGPRTDVDDVSYTTYDIRRRPVFEIGVDPDGSGLLKRSVIRHLYDVDGREYLTERGTGNTITFSNGIPVSVSDFARTNFTETKFDTLTGLPIKTIEWQP